MLQQEGVMHTTKGSSSSSVLDVETGLPSKKALDVFVSLAQRVGRKTTLVRLKWLGESLPTQTQARCVAQALSASKQTSELAVRLDEKEFTVALSDDVDAPHRFLKRLAEWLEPHLPLSISFGQEG